MTCRVWSAAALLLAATGCLSDDKKLTTVSANPFNARPGIQKAQVMHAPATEAVSVGVWKLGQKIVQANPQIKAHTDFTTVGAPQPEIFHQVQQGVWRVTITEGLVKQCQSDGQLAAMLCQELGKLASEQASLVRTSPRRMERAPMPYIPVGTDIPGPLGGADGTYQLELVRFEKERRQIEHPPPPPPPETFARTYLQKAGYDAQELTAVAPLLRRAEENYSLEKQMTAPPTR